MPFNGIGGFTLVAGNPVVTGTTISSTVQNNTMSDFANGFANCMTRDGQSSATANIPMGGFKLTGLAAGTANGDAVRWEQAVLTTNLASTVTPGASLVGASNAQAPAYLKTVSDIISGQIVLIDRFLPQAEIAAIRAGTSTYNCAPDLNDALQAMTSGGGIRAPFGRYYTTEEVVFGATSQRIIFESEGGATLYCAHNGNGINLTATNENYGWHTVRNWIIQGPNVAFPNSAAELAGTSTGAAINCNDGTTTNAAAGYNLTIDNVELKQFYAGLNFRAVLLAKIYALKAMFNQYGVLVDGGQTNAIDFFGASIRQNRVAGVYSTGATGGSLTNATQNRFWGGIIETNIPYRGDNPAGYSGGYRTSRDLLLADGGMGVVLLNSYDWSFYDTYFENQNFDVWLGSSSDSNNFVFTRHGNGGGGRVGGFMFSGAGVIKNKIIGSAAIGSNATDVNVKSDNSGSSDNQFLDTEGFNFIAAELTGKPYVRNNSLNQSGGGTPYGADAIPAHGIGTAVEGTDRGEIDGIGTTTATLNCQGMGTIIFSTGITAATTIDLFTNMTPNSFLVLQSQQATYDVTIKSGAVSNASDIVCLSGTDKVFTEAGQCMVFWCNGIGQAIQVS